MFLEKDFEILGEIFSMARVNCVNTDPKNRSLLENVMNFEAIIKGKFTEANKQLGFEEEVPEPEAKMEVQEGEVEASEVAESTEQAITRVGLGLPFFKLRYNE